MIEKRRSRRKNTSVDVEFEVVEVRFDQTMRVHGRGTIVNISEHGFGMVTDYPLQTGHVVTIKRGEEAVPRFGHVKWIKKEDSLYRVGFSYKFHDEI